jgi:hypothetical protein
MLKTILKVKNMLLEILESYNVLAYCLEDTTEIGPLYIFFFLPSFNYESQNLV